MSRPKGRHRRRPPLHRRRPALIRHPRAISIALLASLGAAAAVSPLFMPADRTRAVATAASPVAAIETPFAASPNTMALTYRLHVAKTHSGKPPVATPQVKLPKRLHVSARSIPRRALAAYVNAARMLNRVNPTCHATWSDIAGIGYIESGHARSGGSGRADWDGEASPAILGPVLNGTDGFAAIRDTDNGKYDGDTQWDRAVGPMQFIPSTWTAYAADGNGDGTGDPENIDDAALATANYLCAVTPDLDRHENLIRAIYGYNHSYDYVRGVLTVIASYRGIDPKRLGIDGLPKAHRHKRHHKHKHEGHHQNRKRHPGGGLAETASPPRPSSPTTSSPTASASPTPTPSDTPTPAATPSPSQSDSPPPVEDSSSPSASNSGVLVE